MPLTQTQKYVPEYYRLRWVMEYSDGRQITGMWSIPGNDKFALASMQSREGLVRVSVHGKHKASKELRILASRPAEIFREFRWISAIKTPGAGFGSQSFHANIQGMELITDQEKITVMINGSVSSEPNNKKRIIGS